MQSQNNRPQRPGAGRPAYGTQPRPAQRPTNGTTSRPAYGAQSRPANGTQSRPAQRSAYGTQPRPANGTQSRPAQRPAYGTQPRTAYGAQSRPGQRTAQGTSSRPATASRSRASSGFRPADLLSGISSAARKAVSGLRRLYARHRIPTLVGAGVILLVVILMIVLFASGGHDDAQTAIAPTSTPEVEATFTPEPTLAPTPSPTPEPAYMANAKYRPAGKDGRLPIFRSASTDEKIIAITVDDCFQAENLRTIVQTAIDCGGKLTIFPIGEIAVRKQQSQILKWAWENGMEIENHTYTHSGLYNVTNERLAEEIYKQNLALCGILGVEYKVHFLRPMGGDARNDQRIHAYINQLGYKGVAHWSDSGSGASLKSLPGMLKPGAIYLFHTTNDDLEKLVRFIPYAVSQGYRLVTLNEMFGYPENETAPLKDISEYPTPTLAPYDYVPVTMRVTNYSYAALQLQEMLIKMGLLDGEPDGIYGKSCANAVKTFQKKMGMKVTGEADPKTQAAILKVYTENFAN